MLDADECDLSFGFAVGTYVRLKNQESVNESPLSLKLLTLTHCLERRVDTLSHVPPLLFNHKFFRAQQEYRLAFELPTGILDYFFSKQVKQFERVYKLPRLSKVGLSLTYNSRVKFLYRQNSKKVTVVIPCLEFPETVTGLFELLTMVCQQEYHDRPQFFCLRLDEPMWVKASALHVRKFKHCNKKGYEILGGWNLYATPTVTTGFFKIVPEIDEEAEQEMSASVDWRDEYAVMQSREYDGILPIYHPYFEKISKECKADPEIKGMWLQIPREEEDA